jgi:iron complex outermembrane receptor protein
VGSAAMSNVKDSYRAGIEIQGGVSFRNSIKWNANLTLSRNRILGMVSFVDNWSYWDDPENEPYQFVTDLGETEISFSPAIIAGSVLHYDIFSAFNIELQSKYVGKQYIDNTMNRDRMLDAYFVNDLKFGYSIPVKWAKAFELNLLIANIFNEKYISNAWVYRYLYEGVEGVTDGYFPQAGFNFFAGASLRF